jgi:tight adherence protein B
MNPLIIGFLVVVGVLAVVVLVLALRAGREGDAEISDRLDTYVGDQVREISGEDIEEQAKRLAKLTDGINKVIERRSFGAKIATQLAQASIKLTVTEYLILNVVSIVLVGAVGYLIFRNFLTIFMFGLGAVLPRIIVNLLKGQRLKKFNDQLGDTINLLVNGIRSGYSMPQAMETVGRDMPPPVSEEFRRVTLEIGLGVPLEDALNHMVRRVQSADLELMITAVNVSYEVGGNLAEILDIISHTIRERVRIQGEIKTLTAQGQITGIVLSGLPFALTGILFVLNREYMGRMFTTTCGWIMSGVALMIIVIGYFIMQKIVKIEV